MLGKAADFEWELAHPGRLVSTMVAECPELGRLFLAAAARNDRPNSGHSATIVDTNRPGWASSHSKSAALPSIGTRSMCLIARKRALLASYSAEHGTSSRSF